MLPLLLVLMFLFDVVVNVAYLFTYFMHLWTFREGVSSCFLNFGQAHSVFDLYFSSKKIKIDKKR